MRTSWQFDTSFVLGTSMGLSADLRADAGLSTVLGTGGGLSAALGTGVTASLGTGVCCGAVHGTDGGSGCPPLPPQGIVAPPGYSCTSSLMAPFREAGRSCAAIDSLTPSAPAERHQ